jgi:UDP-N-acetyl-D-glucosamine dehydrogenase
MEMLQERGAKVDYHDPHIARVKPTREHGVLTGRRSTPLTPANIRRADAVLIVTDHDRVDYALVGREARLVVDTRGVMRRLRLGGSRVVKA